MVHFWLVKECGASTDESDRCGLPATTGRRRGRWREGEKADRPAWEETGLGVCGSGQRGGCGGDKRGSKGGKGGEYERGTIDRLQREVELGRHIKLLIVHRPSPPLARIRWHHNSHAPLTASHLHVFWATPARSSMSVSLPPLSRVRWRACSPEMRRCMLHCCQLDDWIAVGPLSHSVIIVRQRVACISAHASVAKYPAGSRLVTKQEQTVLKEVRRRRNPQNPYFSAGPPSLSCRRDCALNYTLRCIATHRTYSVASEGIL